MKSDSAIISFIENFPVSASLKEADTGKYIINNRYNSRQFGVENPAELVGLTINDLKFCQPEWGAQYAAAIQKLDFRAREKKTHVLGRHQFLDDSGEAQLEEMVKFPVLGSRKNILGIVTYRNDITPTLPPNSLYQLYLNFYDVTSAIKRVLACLEIVQYFATLPTDAQFRVFLLKTERLANKEIAKFLGTSDRTVETHLDALRNKVVDGNLPHVLSLVKWHTPYASDSTPS
ncbi:sigma-70 region 4 domain-containing protein [Paraburkholderia sp. BL21I4N1]|uniref:sigma-70 region 4 domain-containing protein n=1 Tax=Paraburkholderia sp. BL21I4N1 TaxID=1938801 RepID=UPI000CFCC4B9|nr:sigma-70 region 4 domain-containing protein [Paraburkholderia sp. BL21I4N1]PQV52648.1 transcriptional regulator [Paraburkholderia sp. BL21I4N1]